jgi:glycosyltransferase involved in cell wall biosynthesis
MRIFIAVAAFNEAEKIAGVVMGLKKAGYSHIIVVDDHSRDKTGALAKKAGATVIRHKKNMGQGAALRTGINAAVKQKADVVVTFDGDGQHPANEIKRLVKPIIDGKADVALGSRFLGKAPGMPWYKWVTLKGSILVERLVLGVCLTDVHNGFRAFSRKAAEQIEITCNGMTHASEIVYEIKRNKLKYVEVPVTIAYDAYSKAKGQSIFNSFRILQEMLAMKRRKRSRSSL